MAESEDRRNGTLEKIRFLNLGADAGTFNAALEELAGRLETGEPAQAAVINTDVAVRADRDEKLREAICGMEYLFLDGMPLVWLARFYGHKNVEKISGSDLVPALCGRAAQAGKSVFILGGAPGVPEQAAENLKKRFPGIRIAGTCSPPLSFERSRQMMQEAARTVREAAPDLLIVCLGCPKQERFVARYGKDCGARLTVCAGATVDFLAGRVKRCPPWMSRVGLEWFYRFVQEPKRLFKRYFIDDVQIIRLAFRYRPGRTEKARKTEGEEDGED